MTLAFAQGDRELKATTPLGADALVPVAFEGTEALSEPFRFVVTFAAERGSKHKAQSILGKSVTISLAPGTGSGSPRYFNGIVHRFAQVGSNALADFYEAELVPYFSLLQHSADCRTFESKTIIDIVKQVCSDAGLSEIAIRVQATLPTVPYLVQYRESNFAFVSRLLEAAGLYYTFEHAQGKHTFVISDAAGTALPKCAVATVKQNDQSPDEAVAVDHVARLRREFAMHTKSVSVLDHDLLRVDSSGSVTSQVTAGIGEWYDFVGDLGPNDSSDEARRRIEQSEAGHEVISGKSGCRFFEAGRLVTIESDPTGADGADVLLVRVAHRFGQSGIYGGSDPDESIYASEFVAIPASVRWRPPRRTPRPHVQGTQVAKIVGAGGDANIDVDKDGCVLLQFQWDRGAGKSAQSKHRVHVASLWSGQGWGFVQLPRIGQEVLVEFLEGDVDRPIVTGRVYNSKHAHPYKLPDNRTQSGWKSRSVPNGADSNFNELRFEDKKGSEQVYVQAEKDLKTLVKNDETRDVGHDRTTKVKNNDTREVTEGNDSHTIKKGNQTVKVELGKQTITVDGDQSLEVTKGNRKTQVKMGNDEHIVDMGNVSSVVKMGNYTVKVNLGKIEMEAMQSIELKVGANSIKVDQTGVTIKGIMVKVEGSAMTQVKAPMTQVNGDAMLMLKGGITMIN